MGDRQLMTTFTDKVEKIKEVLKGASWMEQIAILSYLVDQINREISKSECSGCGQ